jgi:dienelactone hydrolase
MTEIVLFHHVLGLTPGVTGFADELRQAGHTVHAPDMFGGKRFDSIDAGVAYVMGNGFEQMIDAGVELGKSFPAEVVYAGFSFGAAVAQKLTQTRPGARGALLFDSTVPLEFFGGAWPAGVPAQIHAMDADPSFIDEGDIEAARDLVAKAAGSAELFLYHGDAHLFADSSLPWYDADAAALMTKRVLDFLAGL